MDDRNVESEMRRRILAACIGLLAVYLGVLLFFHAAYFFAGNTARGFYILPTLASLGFLGALSWLNWVGQTRIAAGGFLLLAAEGSLLWLPFSALDQLTVVYALGLLVAGFVLPPTVTFVFMVGVIATHTGVGWMQHALANYNYPALLGLGMFAVAVWWSAYTLEQTRAKLRVHLEDQRAIFEHLPLGVYRTDAQGRILDVNPALVQMLGYPSREALRAVDLATLYVDQRARQDCYLRIERAGEYSLDVAWRRYDGLTLWVHTDIRAARDKQGRLIGYDGAAADISARKQSEDETRQRSDMLAALYETTRDQVARQPVPTLLPILVQRAMALVGAVSGSLYLSETHGQDWAWRVSRENLEPAPQTPLATDRTVIAKVLQTRLPAMLDNYPLLSVRDAETQFSAGAVAAVPLKNSAGVFGVLVVNHTDPLRKFSDADLRTLERFAQHATVAIENAQFFERTQQRAEAFAHLNRAIERCQTQPDETFVLRAACGELQALGQFAFALHQTPTGEWKHIYTAMSAMHQAEFGANFGEREPLLSLPASILQAFPLTSQSQVVADSEWLARITTALQSETKPLADWFSAHTQRHTTWVLPLTRGTTNFGLLLLVSARVEPEYATALSFFAQTVSLALDRLQLANENRHFTAELAMLRRMASLWRTAPTLDQVASSLLAETLSVLGAEDGALVLCQATTKEPVAAAAQGWFKALGEPDLRNEKTVYGNVIATGKLHLSKDWAHDKLALAPTHVPADWGGACIPIPGTRAVNGVICVAVPHPREILPAELRLVHTVVELAGMASASLQLDSQTVQHSRQMQLLRDTNQIVSASLDLQAIANALLERITTHLNLDAAVALILNPETQMLETVSARGFRTRALDNARVRVGDGLAGRAARERRLVRIDNLAKESLRFVRTVLVASEGFVSYIGVPILANGQLKGVIEIFHRAPLRFDPEWQEFLEGVVARFATVVEDTGFFQNLQDEYQRMMEACDATWHAWAHLLEARDHEPVGHLQRVIDLTIRLAQQFQLPANQMPHLERGALLHDIGKLGIADAILLSPNPLTNEEWMIVRRHPQIAYDMLAPIGYLRDSLDIPYCHHERWDGTGYPRGLKGNAIPIAARLFAVVDVWDALTSDRPYRAAWDKPRARNYVQSLAGTQLDSQVVPVFLQLIR